MPENGMPATERSGRLHGPGGSPVGPTRDYPALHTALIGEDYALGWTVGTRPWAMGNRPGDTGRILYHQGDNGRWNCVIYLAPEIDFALLVASNRAGM